MKNQKTGTITFNKSTNDWIVASKDLYQDFDTLKEAVKFAKSNKIHIKETTNISYSLNHSKMEVYINNYLDAEYSSVKNEKQAKRLLMEDYGV